MFMIVSVMDFSLQIGSLLLFKFMVTVITFVCTVCNFITYCLTESVLEMYLKNILNPLLM